MEKLSKEEEVKEDQAIESCALRDRDDVLEAINWIEDDIRKKRWNLALFSDEYLETLMNTMEKFKKWVIEHELPTLFGKWGYEIQVGEDGIALCQCRLGYSYNFNAKRFDFIVRPLKMITLKEVGSDLLTPEQYGEKYGFSAGTIRQWIRRGKVHSAVKKGHSWLIPELSHLVANSEIKYIWEDSPFDPDGLYGFLNEYDSVEFTRAEKKGCFALNMYKLERGRQLVYHWTKKMILEGKEKERLELYLLSNPAVDRQVYPFIHVFRHRMEFVMDDGAEKEKSSEIKPDIYTATEAYKRAINEDFRKNHPRKRYDKEDEAGVVAPIFEVPDLYTLEEWKHLPRGLAGSLGRAFFNLVKSKPSGEIEFVRGGRDGYRAKYRIIKESQK